jgi:hypothetical protein
VVTVGVELVEDDAGDGAVFVWGNAAWCWAAGDEAARRLAAVQSVATDTAGQREVAEACESFRELWRVGCVERRA